ncbi:uncharacterized protein LY89DRAFT_692670 [Mollisia scopiformis]|uniref:BTB domain-containing protein n=1 Tax=Mollisia scopiformis TaxID=149040 RepID=A0A132B185_MOLSC|nr:uncharacterized protein LY89DRAFT_692670 [Mollisia scopiformis]KUJ06136.1 hypothetical protein LY89DRAFT_692670 [Mollisia scopiformis]
MKGGLSEAQVGCTIWKDVSKETFELFVQFAYTGDYSIPKTEKRNTAVMLERMERNSLTDQASRSTSSGIRTWNKAEELNEVLDIEETKEYIEEPVVDEEEKVEEAPFDDDRRMFRKGKKDKKMKGKGVAKSSFGWNREAEPSDRKSSPVVRTTREKYPEPPSPRLLAADFPFLSYPLLAPRNNYDSTCEPVEQFAPDQIYSNVLLAHASLYILGDYQLIDSLKALALYKLHKTLCVFQLDDENVEDIIDFARYAYSEGRGGIGGLRDLVCRYMATNAVVLSHSDGFMDLLGEGGEFVKDFFKYELQMIH